MCARGGIEFVALASVDLRMCCLFWLCEYGSLREYFGWSLLHKVVEILYIRRVVTQLEVKKFFVVGLGHLR